MTEAVLTIAACTLAIGFALGWLCRVLVGEWCEQRDPIDFDEVYRQFTSVTPNAPSHTTRVSATEDFDWVDA